MIMYIILSYNHNTKTSFINLLVTLPVRSGNMSLCFHWKHTLLDMCYHLYKIYLCIPAAWWVKKSVEGTKAIPRLIKKFHHVCSCWHEERITCFSQSVRLSGTVHVRLLCNSMLKNSLYPHKMTFTQLCMELRKCQNTLAEHREPEECHRKIHCLD